MKSFFKAKSNWVLIVLSALLFTACNPVEPNHEGVLMRNYGRNGTSDFSIQTGNAGVLGPGTTLYQVPMYGLTADPDLIEILAKDAGKFTVDPKFTYECIRGKGIDIVFNYKHTGFNDNMDNLETQILNPLVINAFREEARNFTTDSLMNNMNLYENLVQNRLSKEFEFKFFKLNSLTSGLTPPPSMSKAIEERNNAIQKARQAENELQLATINQKKAEIEQKTNEIKSQGLTREILMEKYIEALRNTSNKVIITDGRTPVIFNQ